MWLALHSEPFEFCRLSEVAGARLKNNNPAIADLSDQNRPSKLAEQFSELYDNEWTDTAEELKGIIRKDLKEEDKEIRVVNFLFRVLEVWILNFGTNTLKIEINYHSYNDTLSRKGYSQTYFSMSILGKLPFVIFKCRYQL